MLTCAAQSKSNTDELYKVCLAKSGKLDHGELVPHAEKRKKKKKKRKKRSKLNPLGAREVWAISGVCGSYPGSCIHFL
jgi:hypothetical protein